MGAHYAKEKRRFKSKTKASRDKASRYRAAIEQFGNSVEEEKVVPAEQAQNHQPRYPNAQ